MLFLVPQSHYPDHTPPGSNHSIGLSDDLPQQKSNSFLNKTSTSTASASGSVCLGELTKMYPTPPSLEHNNFDHDGTLDDNNTTTTTPNNSNNGTNPISSSTVQAITIPIIKQEPPDEFVLSRTPDLALPLREDIKGPNIFWPTAISTFIGSDRYKPLVDLPSMREPVHILPGSVYKPSWQYNNNNNNNSNSNSSNSSSNGNNSNSINNNNNNSNTSSNNINSNISEKLQHRVAPSHLPPHNVSQVPTPGKLGSISPVVDRGPGSVGGPSSVGPSLGYELASPASNQSYLSKTVASVEPNAINIIPEANALLVNMVLTDSSLNLFRDHNFDSCTMCVCNNDQNVVVGNIRGSDGALYLPPSHLSPAEEAINCNCGFSAVVNRRLAFQSGLFYEDEVDLTGLHEALVVERKKPSLSLFIDSNKSGDNSERDTAILDHIPESLFKLIQHQCVDTLWSTSSVVQRAAAVYRTKRTHIKMNLVDFKDGNELVQLALEQARLDDNPSLRGTCMHKWAYYQYNGPACSQDLARCMMALKPYLQVAMRKRVSRVSRSWIAPYPVQGPLTLRHFHQIAIRGTEGIAEPLPIPMLLAGHDRDWVSVAPQAIKHWERLMLEPYCQQRNIAYVVVSPDNEFVLNHVRSFFKELSSIYEVSTSLPPPSRQYYSTLLLVL